MRNLAMEIAAALGLSADCLHDVTGFTLDVRGPDEPPTLTLCRVIRSGAELRALSETFMLVRRDELQTLRSLMRITEASESRLRGEAKVLRDLLGEAVGVISVCAGDDDTEAGLLDQLETKIRAALRPPAEFMPNQPLATAAPAQAAINTIATLDPK